MKKLATTGPVASQKPYLFFFDPILLSISYLSVMGASLSKSLLFLACSHWCSSLAATNTCYGVLCVYDVIRLLDISGVICVIEYMMSTSNHHRAKRGSVRSASKSSSCSWISLKKLRLHILMPRPQRKFHLYSSLDRWRSRQMLSWLC